MTERTLNRQGHDLDISTRWDEAVRSWPDDAARVWTSSAVASASCGHRNSGHRGHRLGGSRRRHIRRSRLGARVPGAPARTPETADLDRPTTVRMHRCAREPGVWPRLSGLGCSVRPDLVRAGLLVVAATRRMGQPAAVAVGSGRARAGAPEPNASARNSRRPETTRRQPSCTCRC